MSETSASNGSHYSSNAMQYMGKNETSPELIDKEFWDCP
jgi:hypothetical protein